MTRAAQKGFEDQGKLQLTFEGPAHRWEVFPTEAETAFGVLVSGQWPVDCRAGFGSGGVTGEMMSC